MEETNFDIMRYDLDEDGYILNVYFGCASGTCVGYTGTIPEGYESLDDWSSNANIRAYKIIDGNLVYDAKRDEYLQKQYEAEAEINANASIGYVNNALNKITSPFNETLKKTTNELKINDAGNYEIDEIEIEGIGDLKTAINTTEDARNVNAEKVVIEGNSVQDGTPSPTAPIDIEVVKAPNKLPSEYQKVEYIESTGTQYINTGLSLGDNFKVEAEFSLTEYHATNEQPIFSIWTQEYNYFNLFVHSSKKVDLYTGGHHHTNTQLLLNRKYHTSVQRNDSDWVLTLDNEVISYKYTNTNINPTQLKVLTRGDNVGGSKIKLYSLTAYVDGIKVRELIPCYRKSDNAIGLFDLVNGVFYNNIGTGTFNKGEDVIGVPYGCIREKINGKNFLNFGESTTEWDSASITTKSNQIIFKPNTNGNMGVSHSSLIQNVNIPSGTKLTYSRKLLSGNAQSSGAFTFAIRLNYEDGTKLEFNLGDTTKNNINNLLSTTITTTKKVVSIQWDTILAYAIQGMTSDIVFELQLEVGETATAIEEYKETNVDINLQGNELVKINDVKDELEVVSGLLNKRIGKKVFTGDENWLFQSGGSSDTSFLYSLSGMPLRDNSNINIISTHFNGINAGDNWINRSGETISLNNGGVIHIRTSTFATVDELKAYLQEKYEAGTPVIAYYKLATPQEIQLDPVDIPLYEGVNNLSVISTLDTNINVSYRSLETTFENGLKLQVSNSNLLVNTGIKETIGGIDFTPNEDGTLHIEGTATENVEYELCGTMENTKPIFMMEGVNPIVSDDWYWNFSIMPYFINGEEILITPKLYSYDGVDRELVSSDFGAKIEAAKYITCATLNIASGTTINADVGFVVRKEDNTGLYTEAKVNEIIDINIDKLLYDEKIVIGKNSVKVVDSEGNEETIKVIEPIISYVDDNEEFHYTLIQASEKVNIKTTYSTNISLAGFEVTTNGLEIEIKSKYNYTEEDHLKLRNYLIGIGTLTEEEMIKYDVSGDGQLMSNDALLMKHMLNYGITTEKGVKFKIGNGELTNMFNFLTITDGNDNILTNIGITGVETNSVKTDSLRINGEESSVDIEGSGEVTLNGDAFNLRDLYYKAGDTIEYTWCGAGYVTNGGQDVYFFLPLSKLILGTPTVNIDIASAGLTIRQNNKYCYGSSASARCVPNSYYVSIQPGGLFVRARFSNTTNVTNNSPIGVDVNLTITLSEPVVG